jgi:flavin reductase (DIM6/NTAB) family NADH-FMN oxidoreductase RutF
MVTEKAFTVSIPSAKYVKEVDFFGIVSGRDTNKFELTGLNAIKSEVVHAPYVKEFPLVHECVVKTSIDLGLHTMFIGEILDSKVDESVMGKDERPDILKIKPYSLDFLRHEYYHTGTLLGKAFSDGKVFQNREK